MASPRDQRVDDDDDEDILPAPEQPDIVNITKALDDGRVGVWDRHPLHPPSREYPNGGEVYLDQFNEVIQAHRSPGINQKINEGSLRIVNDADASRLMRRYQRGRDRIEERRQGVLAEQREALMAQGFMAPSVPSPSPAAPVASEQPPERAQTPPRNPVTTEPPKTEPEKPAETTSGESGSDQTPPTESETGGSQSSGRSGRSR